MHEEPAVLLVGAQLDDPQLVDRPALVGALQPGVDAGLFAQADHHDVAFLAGPGFELILHQLQVEQGQRMVEGDDLDELFAQGAVEEDVGLETFDADVLHGQIDGLVVLDAEVVVVDAVDGEGQGSWWRRRVGIFEGGEGGL